MSRKVLRLWARDRVQYLPTTDIGALGMPGRVFLALGRGRVSRRVGVVNAERMWEEGEGYGAGVGEVKLWGLLLLKLTNG